MRSQLRQALTAALKARDRAAVSALRSAIAAIENAESVDVTTPGVSAASSEHFAGASAGVGSSDVDRRVLTEADVIAVVRRQVDERLEAADEYVTFGRADEAARLRREAEVLREHLPAGE